MIAFIKSGAFVANVAMAFTNVRVQQGQIERERYYMYIYMYIYILWCVLEC